MTSAADARDSREPRPWSAPWAALVCALLFSVLPLEPKLGFIAVVSPFPLVLQRLRGTGPALAALAATLALLTACFGFEMALGFAIFLAAPAWLIGEAMVRGHGLRRGCIWAFVLVSLELAVVMLMAGPEITEGLRHDMAARYSTESLHALPSFWPAEAPDQWLERTKAMTEVLVVIYPSVFIVLGGLAVLMNGALVRSYLVRRDPAWLEGGEFEALRWPFGLSVVFVLSGLSVLSPPLRPVAYNVLVLVAFLVTLQGLAVALYYAHRLAGPALLRAALVLSIIVWASQLLALLGLLDLWFDFRRFADIPESPK